MNPEVLAVEVMTRIRPEGMRPRETDRVEEVVYAGGADDGMDRRGGRRGVGVNDDGPGDLPDTLGSRGRLDLKVSD